MNNIWGEKEFKCLKKINIYIQNRNRIVFLLVFGFKEVIWLTPNNTGCIKDGMKEI